MPSRPATSVAGDPGLTDTLTTQDAARAVAVAARYEDALVQRTEGLTGMAWAPVGPGIYLTYAYAETLAGFPPWGFSLLWIPWVLAGGLTTFALWRSAALSAPRMRDPLTPLGYLWRFLAFIGGISAVFAVWNPQHYGAPLVVIGVMYLLYAILDPYRSSGRGRRVMGVCGAILVAASAAAFALPHSPVGFAGAVLASGLAPLAAGLWQTLRG